MAGVLQAIRRYPVKSCRGDELPEAVVEPWGLEGDRRWMLVGDDLVAVTARVEPRMLLIHPTPTAHGLRLTAPGVDPIEIARPDGRIRSTVDIWSQPVDAADAGDAAARWFSTVLARSVRLVHLDDPTARPLDAATGPVSGSVSFADGNPLLLTTTASLAALDEAIAERDPDEMVPMTRFRPNVVVTGTRAWEEDDWRRIRIGDVVFRVAGGCARCNLTMVDPDTAEKGKEPIRTLATIRRFDGATWFGVDLVPELEPGQRPVLRIGDDLEVLESVPPGGGPLRRDPA